MLEDNAVVDNVVVSIGLNDAEVDVIKSELPWVELPRSNTILLQVDIANTTFSIYTSIVAGKSLYRLAAKIAVARVGFVRMRDEARLKIRLLAEKLSIEEVLVKRDIRWNRIDLATYTPDVGEVDLMAKNTSYRIVYSCGHASQLFFFLGEAANREKERAKVAKCWACNNSEAVVLRRKEKG